MYIFVISNDVSIYVTQSMIIVQVFGMEFDMFFNERAHVPKTMVVISSKLLLETIIFLVQSIN